MEGGRRGSRTRCSGVSRHPSAIGHRFGVTVPTGGGLPHRRGTDAPHRLWIGVLRGREVSGSTRGAGTAVIAGEVPQLKVHTAGVRIREVRLERCSKDFVVRDYR